MNCYIKSIIIFNKEGEKRFVPFKPGLNIITGNSKTGKSALIEIVDYCLCSKTSSVPRGEISGFAHLYITVFAFESKFLVVGRKAFIDGGNSKVFVKVELDEQAIENINLEYFTDHYFILRDNAKNEIEKHLNMAVSNMADSNDVNDRERRKTSLREMTSFLFQHQNLIANKHALFYRFEVNIKRQATIDSFPVFVGWANDTYYSLKREIDDKEKLIRQIESQRKKNIEALKAIEKEIKGYFITYYALVGKPFNNNLSLQQLISLQKDLPNFTSKAFVAQDILIRYNKLSVERDDKNSELLKIGKQIKDLQQTELYANEFQSGLKALKIKNSDLNVNNDSFSCPTCGKEAKELTEELSKVTSAKENLSKELSQLGNYAVSYQKEVELLKRQFEQTKKDIKLLTSQIDEIERITKSIEVEKNASNQAIYAKAQIDLRINLFLNEQKPSSTDDLKVLKGELELLKNELESFDIPKFYKKTEVFLSNNMNKIGNKLDFEDQLKPLDFWFDLRDFTFSHKDKKMGSISLNEMGSGANWLTCHLSLFLSLLHCFSRFKKSVIPTFLFLDQPSQVYFPSTFGVGENKDNDIKQVEKVYIAILEELDEINKEAGFMPQVIVTDHADNLDLGKYIFNDYVRKRWTPENDGALI